MAGLFGEDGQQQGGLLGIDPYTLATIAQLFGAKKGDNWGLNIANIESQRQAAQNRAQQGQLTQFQINQAKRAEQDDLAARKTIADFYQGQQGPPSPSGAAPQQQGQPVAIPAPGGGTTVAPEGAGSGKFSTFNRYNAIADQLERSGNLPQSKAYRDLAEKFRPELKDTKTLTDPQSGQRVTVNFYKDGTREVVPFAPDKEKAHMADTGGSVVPLDPFTGQPLGGGIKKTMAPGESARLAQDESHFQQNFNAPQVENGQNGMFVVDKRSGTAQPVLGPDGKPVNTGNLTESQAKATVFLGQMKGASNQLAQIDQSAGQKFGVQLGANLAGQTGKLGMVANAVSPELTQKYAQAQNQWAEAFLRFKSGAAVTETEVSRNIRSFFPQPGDSPGVVAQKAEMRKQAEAQMELAAGQGAQRIADLPGMQAPPSIDDLVNKYRTKK